MPASMTTLLFQRELLPIEIIRKIVAYMPNYDLFFMAPTKR